MLYRRSDYSRSGQASGTKIDILERPPFRRDYARLIHSPAFRRLQGKTQLFPGVESDFFRNRLTHSLEVAQIAKSIAIRINANKPGDQLDLDLIELAALAHDLGHPPFGHNGEAALDECMREYGGFEGNAQTLRILARLEKKGDTIQPFSGPSKEDTRNGLMLTHRSLAAVLKYDNMIPIANKDRKKPNEVNKGYYASEAGLVSLIKKNVLGRYKYSGKFKTIECQIMDLADDIAYSTYDLEDTLKAGFIDPMQILSDVLNEPLMTKLAKDITDKTETIFTNEMVGNSLLKLFTKIGLSYPDELLEELKNETNKNVIFAKIARYAIESFATSSNYVSNGYARNELTSKLVDRFIRGLVVDWDERYPVFSKVSFDEETFPLVEVLKRYTFEKIISSSRLKVSEYRGGEIVKTIFIALSDSGHVLLPQDFQQWYLKAPTKVEQKRVICDFIAGMTDRYAIEFYGRLKSETPQSIYKPI